MLIDLRTGPQIVQDGGIVLGGRADRLGSIVTTDGQAHYGEIVRRGSVYTVSTAIAGTAPGTALSATNPFALLNPANSGVVIYVLRTSMAFVSGTLGAGTLNYVYGIGQTTVPASSLTSAPALIGATTQPSGRAYTATAMTATAALLRPWASISVAAPGTGTIINENVDGEFAIMPGAYFGMTEIGAAGTTPLVQFGCTWAELPL